ncbi:MAG TPA: hypothetical protein VFJ24_04785 [Gaiellales bacterium]|nr:hypothetical protein [Gaiellales bacterium]
MMRRGTARVIDVLLALLGVGLFAYGDVVANRSVRLLGVVLTTVCVVAAAILAAFRRES